MPCLQRATDSTSPGRFEATGTIIDIPGESAEINVDFQLIRVFGYSLTPKGPGKGVEVLSIAARKQERREGMLIPR